MTFLLTIRSYYHSRMTKNLGEQSEKSMIKRRKKKRGRIHSTSGRTAGA